MRLLPERANLADTQFLKQGVANRNYYRVVDFFGAAREYGGFIDDNVVLLEHCSNSLASLYQRFQIGTFVFINRRRYRDDKYMAGIQFLGVGRKRKLVGCLEVSGSCLERPISTNT